MSKSKKPRAVKGALNITRREFAACHFGGAELPSDMFYVGVANRILPLILKCLSGAGFFSTGTCRHLALTLTCYVEDLVAGSGIWAAFTSLHNKKYGKPLPFYNLREDSTVYPYDDELPSFHAVRFLCWYVLNDSDPETMLNPNNPGIRTLAMVLMPELTGAYDEAPETPARLMLMPEEEIGVPLFYQIRNLCTWLCDRCYLTRIADMEALTDDFNEIMSGVYQTMDCVEESAEIYNADVFTAMNALIGPLALPAHKWLAEIVNLYHESEEEQFLPVLDAMKSRPYQLYRYESVSESEAVLETVDGDKLTLSAYTMPGERFAPEVEAGDSALMSLVSYDGAWVMNGLGVQALPAEAFSDARKASREKSEQSREVYKYHMKRFHKARIGVCGSYEEYMKLAFGDNAPEGHIDADVAEDIRHARNILYFLNTDGTVSILPDFAQAVKIKDNPYYDPKEARSLGLSLILNHDLTTPEMREYIITHKLIPDAALNSAVSPEAGRKLFQQNIGFFNDYASRDTLPDVLSL